MSIYTTSTGGILAGWQQTGNIGTLVPGEISELYIKAEFSTSTVYPCYTLTSGALPAGLTLNRDGAINGQVLVNTSSNLTTTSSFVVSIIDTNNTKLIEGNFSITVKQTTATDYTSIYCKPLLALPKRSAFLEFIKNQNIFDPKFIYRPFDANFGTQQEIKVVLDFGVKKLTLEQYAGIISTNFDKRRLYLGNIKSAVSKNPDGSVRYELVYVEVIDPNVNSKKESIPSEITYNDVTYYPSSITNIRQKFAKNTSVTSIRNPSFTTTVQQGDAVKLGYIAFVPLCFTIPEKSGTVIRKIKESGFKFNTVDLEIDRIVVQNSVGQIGAKYLLLPRNPRLA